MANKTIPGPKPRNHRYSLSGTPDKRRARPGSPLSKYFLLKLNLGADFFELRLDLGGVVLVGAFLDGLWRAFDQILGLLKAQARNRAHFLNDLDLLVAGSGKNHREFGLLFGGGRRCARGTCRHRNGGSGGNAPLLLQQLGELGSLEHSEA